MRTIFDLDGWSLIRDENGTLILTGPGTLRITLPHFDPFQLRCHRTDLTRSWRYPHKSALGLTLTSTLCEPCPPNNEHHTLGHGYATWNLPLTVGVALHRWARTLPGEFVI